MITETEALHPYLTFRIGEEIFATDVSNVREIMEIPPVTRIPLAPSFVRGVINVRGTVTPLIDTRVRFGLTANADIENSSIVILELGADEGPITVGALVDSHREVVEIHDNEIQAASAGDLKYQPNFVRGIVNRNDQFIVILETNVVFSIDEDSVTNESISGDQPPPNSKIPFQPIEN